MRRDFPFSTTPDTGRQTRIAGLDAFTKGLERLFFASASVRRLIPDGGQEQLVLDLKCPLSLIETLYHYRQGNWGTAQNHAQPDPLALSDLVETLNAQNEVRFQISEFTLEFTDMLLVFQRAGRQPIEAVLPFLLEQLTQQVIVLSHGMQQLPEELYIPIQMQASTQPGQQDPPNLRSPYRYWGLYLEGDLEGRVYDSLTGAYLADGIDLILP